MAATPWQFAGHGLQTDLGSQLLAIKVMQHVYNVPAWLVCCERLHDMRVIYHYIVCVMCHLCNLCNRRT